MDAVELFKAFATMHYSLDDERGCIECPLAIHTNEAGLDCWKYIESFPEDAVSIVAKWWEQNKPLEFTDEQIEALKALSVLGAKYLAKDEDGEIYAHTSKPNKDDLDGQWKGDWIAIYKFPDVPDFPQIKWEDTEPVDIKKYLETLKK